jgi:hypothetical protein
MFGRVLGVKGEGFDLSSFFGDRSVDGAVIVDAGDAVVDRA